MGIVDDNHNCPVCDERFSSEKALEEHMKEHLGWDRDQRGIPEDERRRQRDRDPHILTD